ncbi:30S ribosomal protein S17 [Bacteriovoracaceae bacterium]|mgnify:CR=1 FL=1|nr:30S ribosomal protein S17 [Bacteriovoracaceae bacterium]|tara:strand:+ start:5087 stop:5341 length:255 start_codon:yes stop_codon:yes gene_type:complete
MSTTEVTRFKRRLEGIVVKDGNEKTIVVNVVRRYKHKQYNKFVSVSKKYHAHDTDNKAKSGDKVTIIESKPYSKLKKWELLSIN